jgi:hypothetical protein
MSARPGTSSGDPPPQDPPPPEHQQQVSTENMSNVSNMSNETTNNGPPTRRNSFDKDANREKKASKESKHNNAVTSILERIDQHAAVLDKIRLEIGSNYTIVQIRKDLKAQNKHVAEMAAAMKLQMEQLTAMSQQMIQTRDLVGNLQRGDVTLNDIKGLQDSILKLKEDILQSIRSEGEKIESRIISKINGTSSPAGKRQRKVSINNRQQTASNGTRSEIDADMDVNSEVFSGPGYTNYTPMARPVQATRKASFRNRTNQNGQTYARAAAGRPVGLPAGPNQGQKQQKPPPPGPKTT